MSKLRTAADQFMEKYESERCAKEFRTIGQVKMLLALSSYLEQPDEFWEFVESRKHRLEIPDGWDVLKDGCYFYQIIVNDNREMKAIINLTVWRLGMDFQKIVEYT